MNEDKIDIENPEWSKMQEKAFKNLAKNLKIPGGFRPGTPVGGQAVLGRQYSFATPWLTERHGYHTTGVPGLSPAGIFKFFAKFLNAFACILLHSGFCISIKKESSFSVLFT